MYRLMPTIVVLVSVATPCLAGRATVMLIEPPASYAHCRITDVTPDGRTACGTAWNDSDGRSTAFWWTQEGGVRVVMPFVNPNSTSAAFVSARLSSDGTTIVGGGLGVQSNDVAARWRLATGGALEVVAIGSLPGRPVILAGGVSDDGARVGYWSQGTSRYGYDGLCRIWPELMPLGTPDLTHVVDGGGAGSGFSLVGTLRLPTTWGPTTQSSRAFRHWPTTGVTIELPPEGGSAAQIHTTASAMSPSGQLVAGSFRAWQSESALPMLWENGVPRALECPSRAFGTCTVMGVSDRTATRGPLAVGYTQDKTATIWWPDGHAESLRGLLRAQGERFANETYLDTSNAVTGDGRMIAGMARVITAGVPRFLGYVATLGTTCAADIDNGTGVGVPDDAVDMNDLVMALSWFESGDVRFDIDDGSGNGTRDEAVTIDDVLHFLARFEVGC